MTELLPNEHQKSIANLLGIDISQDTLEIAAARIEDFVSPAIYPGKPARMPTDKQILFASSLGIDVTKDSFCIASVKIDQELQAKNRRAIIEMNLKPGDCVVKHESVRFNDETHDLDREYIISSIGRNGRIWFKGGNGQGAWATQLEKLNP